MLIRGRAHIRVWALIRGNTVCIGRSEERVCESLWHRNLKSFENKHAVTKSEKASTTRSMFDKLTGKDDKFVINYVSAAQK